MDKQKGKPSLAYITQVLRDMGLREREIQALLDKRLCNSNALGVLNKLNPQEVSKAIEIPADKIDPKFQSRLRRALQIINDPNNDYVVRQSSSRSTSPSGRTLRRTRGGESRKDVSRSRSPDGAGRGRSKSPEQMEWKAMGSKDISSDSDNDADSDTRSVVSSRSSRSERRSVRRGPSPGRAASEASKEHGPANRSVISGELHSQQSGLDLTQLPLYFQGKPVLVGQQEAPGKDIEKVIHKHLSHPLLQGHKLKKKERGITTRAVWLEWEKKKNLILAAPTQEFPESKTDMLYKKTHNNLKHWTYRKVRAELYPGVLTYWRVTGEEKKVWVMPGCFVQHIDSTHWGRTFLVRIVWPSGFDIILSCKNAKESRDWFEYLATMVNPPRYVRERRMKLFENPSAQALVRSTVRSYHFKIRRVAGFHEAHVIEVTDLPSLVKEKGDENDVFLWSIGYPYSKYPETPEFHGSYAPVEHKDAWISICSIFPDRHQEELRRFLISKNYNVEKATIALREHITWRQKHIPLHPESILKELGLGKIYVRGQDFHGHPVVHVQEKRHFQSNFEDTCKSIIYRVEQAIAMIPVRDGKITIFYNRKGSTHSNADPKLLSWVIDTFRKHYPERLFNFIIYPSSSFAGTFQLLALGVNTRPKIKFVSTDVELHKFIPKKYLGPDCQGIDSFDFEIEARQSSVILTPRLWTGGSAVDYYPPERSVEVKKPAPSFEKKLADYLCKECKDRPCRICLGIKKGPIGYLGGWQPIDIEKEFPKLDLVQ